MKSLPAVFVASAIVLAGALTTAAEAADIKIAVAGGAARGAGRYRAGPAPVRCQGRQHGPGLRRLSMAQQGCRNRAVMITGALRAFRAPASGADWGSLSTHLAPRCCTDVGGRCAIAAAEAAVEIGQVAETGFERDAADVVVVPLSIGEQSARARQACVEHEFGEAGVLLGEQSL